MKRRVRQWGRATLLYLTFGVFFFDYDLDGHPDIFAANGHIEEEDIGRVQPKVSFRRCPCCFTIRDGENVKAPDDRQLCNL